MLVFAVLGCLLSIRGAYFVEATTGDVKISFYQNATIGICSLVVIVLLLSPVHPSFTASRYRLSLAEFKYDNSVSARAVMTGGVDVLIDNRANALYGADFPAGALDLTVTAQSDPPFHIGKIYTSDAFSVPSGGRVAVSLHGTANFSTPELASTLAEFLYDCLFLGEVEFKIAGTVIFIIGGIEKTADIDHSEVTNCFGAAYAAISTGDSSAVDDYNTQKTATVASVCVLALIVLGLSMWVHGHRVLAGYHQRFDVDREGSGLSAKKKMRISPRTHSMELT
jgi:hypothetical protein